MGEWAPDDMGSELGGTYGDWNADVAPAGAGGDPYGGGDWAGFGDGSDYTEAESTNMLPGGAENQFTPFSPGGGWDFTDVLRQSSLARGLVGPNGFLYDTGGDNLGVSPMPAPYRGRGAPGALGAASSAGDIVRWVRQSTGLRVTARSIVNLIVRYGFKATAAMTQLDFGSLLKLFMRQKGVTHHKRGPGLYTVARKLRAASRLQATVARILGRGGGHRRRGHARRAPPFRHFKKKRGRR